MASCRNALLKPLLAGTVYFLLVFLLGFVLGVVRTMLSGHGAGVPRIVGVLIELPVMLAASWFACRLVSRRMRLAATLPPRAVMAATAFGLMMIAEASVSMALAGRSLSQHLALYASPDYSLGLLAQIAYAAFPIVQRRYGAR